MTEPKWLSQLLAPKLYILYVCIYKGAVTGNYGCKYPCGLVVPAAIYKIKHSVKY